MKLRKTLAGILAGVLAALVVSTAAFAEEPPANPPEGAVDDAVTSTATKGEGKEADTGVEGVAALFGLAVVATGAAVLSKKKS